MALSATRAASRRVSHLRSSRLPTYRHHAFSTSHASRRPDAFHSMLEEARKASDLLSANPSPISNSPQTRTEKIIQKHSVGLAPGKIVKSGDYVSLQPQHCMSHDNSFPIVQKFLNIGASKIHNNRQVVFTLDHDIQNKTESNLKKYAFLQEFARTHGIDFYGKLLSVLQKARSKTNNNRRWPRYRSPDHGRRGLCLAEHCCCRI